MAVPSLEELYKRTTSMSTQEKTEQEAFWEGQFGDEYVTRNQGAQLIASNTQLFANILARSERVSSVIELGANIGNNLRALRNLLPDSSFAAVEINASAVAELNKLTWLNRVFHQSILDFSVEGTWEMALIKGVLIHIAPEDLPRAYDALYAAASRYICIVEYYNPTPVEIPYRGHRNKLFKRDFAGDMLDRFSDLKLVDYGFVYHRDKTFPLDDPNWFLLEKA